MIKSEFTFGQRMQLGFAIAAFVLAVVATVGHRSVVKLNENDHLVEHSQLVRQDIARLLLVIKDAETDQRGYTITGNEAFIEPFKQTLPEVDRVLEDLRQITSDNAVQQRHLDLIKPLILAKVDEMKRVIDGRRLRGFDVAQKMVESSKSKELMDQIRKILEDMDQDEDEILRRRFADSKASAHAAQVVMLWGGVLGVVFITILGLFMARSLSLQIIRAVGHIQGSSSELQAAANQQALGAREQATAMTEISATISQLLTTSRQIADSAKRVAHISGETGLAASRGDQTVQRANESVASIRVQVDLIVGHMLDLGKKSQQIGGILEIINELADQTNILSINASVEAAGAGEAGRRFAVVADEIRKLADRVGGSTKEIRSLVEEVRAAVNTTVMATEGGAKASEAGTKQFGELAASLQGIVALVTTSTAVAREIELSTKQQATAVEQVTIAISGMAQATRSTETSSEQTLQTAKELGHLSKQLSRLVQADVQA